MTCGLGFIGGLQWNGNAPKVLLRGGPWGSLVGFRGNVPMVLLHERGDASVEECGQGASS